MNVPPRLNIKKLKIRQADAYDLRVSFDVIDADKEMRPQTVFVDPKVLEGVIIKNCVLVQFRTRVWLVPDTPENRIKANRYEARRLAKSINGEM